jgi:hypothetical protein
MKNKQAFIKALDIKRHSNGHYYIGGDVCGNVWGHVKGDVCGDVEGHVWGDGGGNVWGTVNGSKWQAAEENNDEV